MIQTMQEAWGPFLNSFKPIRFFDYNILQCPYQPCQVEYIKHLSIYFSVSEDSYVVATSLLNHHDHFIKPKHMNLIVFPKPSVALPSSEETSK